MLAFRNYLIYQRKEPRTSRHPYAFTNTTGAPETRKNFRRLHSAAVERIGLVRGKYYGTTEHGHRHAYGYRLASAGFSQLDIQKSMHHKSIDSCTVYTQLSNSDIRNLMRQHEQSTPRFNQNDSKEL
ncbi:site-specific integrase [Pseudomonas mohnii]|nr:site-specific integrase [Pseudomonas mohnii]